MDKPLAFDPTLINHWVIVWQLPDDPTEPIPSGGPFVAWLHWVSWSRALRLELACAVFITRAGNVSRVGPIPRRRDGTPFVYDLAHLNAQPLPDAERLRLALPVRPDGHPETPFDHDAAPAALHAHGLRCRDAGDLDGAEQHLRAAIAWSHGEAFYRASLASFYADHFPYRM